MKPTKERIILVLIMLNCIAISTLFLMVLGLQDDLQSNRANDFSTWNYQERVNAANNLSPYR